MKKIVVTGGAGFIGSYVVDGILAHYPTATVTVYDALTYAGSMSNLESAQKTDRLNFVKGDIRNEKTLLEVMEGADAVISCAAESHVDRSFHNPKTFLETNVTGSHNVFQACREAKVPRILHISTDEVYGPRAEGDDAREDSIPRPTNPYSASKAAADMLANAAFQSYGVPITIVRPNNVYGHRQYPEKLIPRFVLAAAEGQPLTLHGSGEQRRRFLAVQDLVDALLVVLERGDAGAIYNIGVRDPYSVLDIVDLVGSALKIDTTALVRYVEDRPFNDHYYATDCNLVQALGWQPKRSLRDDFAALATDILTRSKALRTVTTDVASLPERVAQ